MTHPDPYIEEVMKKFDKLWLRMREGGFGQKISLDGRMIWDVGGDDEGAYVFANDSIKRFILDIYEAQKAATKTQRIKDIEEKEELAESLLGMYEQYCDDGHQFMSAGEDASSVLERQGYASFDAAGRIISTSRKAAIEEDIKS